jgi:RNA polymerase sigma-70 factor (ECF subfamily)
MRGFPGGDLEADERAPAIPHQAADGPLHRPVEWRYCGRMDDASLDDWFAREILVHEGALVAFLMRAWPHRAEVHDLRQEVYVRVYEAAGKARPAAPRAFLFATARHLVTDRLRRGRVVSIESVGDLDALNVLVDEVSPERRLDARQVLWRLAAAFDRLPGRCREVVWLRRVEELPQKEVAARLGISEKTVEKQVAKGMRLLAGYFYGNGRADPVRAAEAEDAPGHGRQHPD